MLQLPCLSSPKRDRSARLKAAYHALWRRLRPHLALQGLRLPPARALPADAGFESWPNSCRFRPQLPDPSDSLEATRCCFTDLVWNAYNA